jgi:hypothetical protein
VIKHVCGFAAILLAAASASAQAPAPGNINAIEFQTPKVGMTAQYEQGRKQKVEWHKQQKDSAPLYVFETLTGDNTGTFLVGRLDEHWADLDHPSVSDAADTEQFNKLIGSTVQSVTERFYEFLPKMSNPDASMGPSKYDEMITFRIKRDKISDFRAALERASEAAKKQNWSTHYEFYEQIFGGPLGTFVLIEPHASFADFEDKPDAKPLRKILEEAFGQTEADGIYGRLVASIESEDGEILAFRQDLSYIPAK